MKEKEAMILLHEKANKLNPTGTRVILTGSCLLPWRALALQAWVYSIRTEKTTFV